MRKTLPVTDARQLCRRGDVSLIRTAVSSSLLVVVVVVVEVVVVMVA